MESACRQANSDFRDTSSHFCKECSSGHSYRKLALEQLLSQHFYAPHLTSLASNIYKQCDRCAKHNPKQGPFPKRGIQHLGSSPFEDLEIDFTELPRTRGYKYLLVIVCTFSGWVQASPPEQRSPKKWYLLY
jgi:hypothetical protein